MKVVSVNNFMSTKSPITVTESILCCLGDTQLTLNVMVWGSKGNKRSSESCERQVYKDESNNTNKNNTKATNNIMKKSLKEIQKGFNLKVQICEVMNFVRTKTQIILAVILTGTTMSTI